MSLAGHPRKQLTSPQFKHVVTIGSPSNVLKGDTGLAANGMLLGRSITGSSGPTVKEMWRNKSTTSPGGCHIFRCNFIVRATFDLLGLTTYRVTICSFIRPSRRIPDDIRRDVVIRLIHNLSSLPRKRANLATDAVLESMIRRQLTRIDNSTIDLQSD